MKEEVSEFLHAQWISHFEPELLDSHEMAKSTLDAAKKGRSGRIKFLIASGSDLNYAINGKTAMDAAIKYLRPPILHLLLEHGAVIPDNALNNAIKCYVDTFNESQATMDQINRHRHGKKHKDKKLSVAEALCFEKEIIWKLVNSGAKIGESILLIAVLSNDYNLIQLLVENGAKVTEITDVDGSNALMLAVHMGKSEIVKLLISNGGNPNSVDKQGSTPLIDAIQKGNTEMVGWLTSHGADVLQMRAEDTPLAIACQVAQKHDFTNSLEIIRILLSKGAKAGKSLLLDIVSNHYDNQEADLVKLLIDHGVQVTETADKRGNTVLFKAVEQGKIKLISLLVKHGANINAVNKSHDTVLLQAVKQGNFKIVSWLVSHGVDLLQKSEEESSVAVACRYLHPPILNLLLEHGAKIPNNTLNNAIKCYVDILNESDGILDQINRHRHGKKHKDKKLSVAEALSFEKEIIWKLVNSGAKIGESILLIAVLSNDYSLIQLLIENGAKVTEITDVDGSNALMLAVHIGNSEIVKLLINNGGNPNSVDKQGSTPLIDAIQKGNTEMVGWLTSHGADVLQMRAEDTPLAIACQVAQKHDFTKSLEIIHILLSKGAKAGESLLLDIVSNHYDNQEADLVKLLIDHGVQVTEKADERDNTVLFKAVEQGNIKLITLLVNHGANVNAVNKSQDTPLLVASRQGDNQAASLLITHNADLTHKNKEHYTPLMEACSKGHVLTAKLLMKLGADVNEPNDTASPLSVAVEHLEMVKCLVSAKANLSYLDKRSKTPLHHAVSLWDTNKSLPVIEFLVLKKTPLNLGKPILLEAVERDCVERLTLLIDNGADWKLKDTSGNTMLLQAASSGSLKVVKWILQNKYGSLTEKNNKGASIFLTASSALYLDVVKWLWETYGKTYFMTEMDDEGNTALLSSARNFNSLNFIQYFIMQGIPWNQRNHKQHNVLTICENSYHDTTDVVKWVLSHCNHEITDSDITDALTRTKKKKTLLALHFHLEWKRIRLLLIGQKDINSTLSMLPEEIVNGIVKIYTDSVWPKHVVVPLWY